MGSCGTRLRDTPEEGKRHQIVWEQVLPRSYPGKFDIDIYKIGSEWPVIFVSVDSSQFPNI